MNFVLAQRLELLDEVARLQQSLGVEGDVSYTCETAAHFFLYQVRKQFSECQHCTRLSQIDYNIYTHYEFHGLIKSLRRD